MMNIRSLCSKFRTLAQLKNQAFSVQIVKNSHEAVAEIGDNKSIVFAGFGLAGIPENSIQALVKKGSKGITAITNTAGVSDWGLGLLLANRQIKRVVASYMGENPLFEKLYMNGEVEVQLTPQGTLGEKLRSGSNGVPAFFTPTGVSTFVEYGKVPLRFKRGSPKADMLAPAKERRIFNGKPYILEETIQADYSLLKAKVADTEGNLIYFKTANNFNQDGAGCGKKVICEVEEIVPAGTLDPDHIHTSGIYVDKVYIGEKWARRIEKCIYDKGNSKDKPKFMKARKDLIKEKIAKRCAKELKDGMYVNLGIGFPTLVPQFIPEGVSVETQSEIGIIGVGRYPRPGEEHAEIINAGKEAITIKKGASTFSSSVSFGIIRGGHLDMTILGSMQVSRTCDIANWIIPGKKVKGMGGAMDLVSGGSKVIVAMQHCGKGKDYKILERCTLPLTGKGVVDMVVTEMAVFERIDNELVMTEIAEEFTLDEVKEHTGYAFKHLPIDKIKTF